MILRSVSIHRTDPRPTIPMVPVWDRGHAGPLSGTHILVEKCTKLHPMTGATETPTSLSPSPPSRPAWCGPGPTSRSGPRQRGGPWWYDAVSKHGPQEWRL